ncbi:MAG: sigma-70 family RNA polymerase sigma factor [Planctomycetota bacterium]|nr:sigma-70 family RNA polymerase sigma factor [Planctomycetota bacterium]
MRKYQNKCIGELALELAAGLSRLRKGYIDAAEALARVIDPARQYPYEFVVYRLTGYRPRPKKSRASMSGDKLRLDLLQLMLDVCDSMELCVGDYAERVSDTPQLARRFSVSSKTVQRWRGQGLPARRLVFPDGKRRLAFLESSVGWFVASRRRQVSRSMRFSKLKPQERREIIQKAKRIAKFTRCTLGEVAKRLAARTGRAAETIRYTIRRHDKLNPQEAVFPHMDAPLRERQRSVIYQSFLRGASVPVLARRYRRTRGSIYRIVNEIRARQLIDRPIPYMHNSQFDMPNADELILSTQPDEPDEQGKKAARPPADLPAYLRSLYEVPLLSRQREQNLFRRYNYLKHKADKLRKLIDVNRIRTDQLQQIEALLLQANAVKNQLIRANLRLVVSIAKKHLGGAQTLFELISDGNVSLMAAVEKFDYARGNRFSTYASWAIMRNFARSVPKEQYRLDRFATGADEILDIAGGLQNYDPDEVNIPELRESIDIVLAQLSARERAILIDRYGLDGTGAAKTLQQLSRRLGISKERVRQIERKAISKLRKIMHPQKVGMPA